MEFKDYYETLGVARSASADEIQKAYRKLARKFHPDVSQEADADARFKEISEAYEVLKDPEKRSKYDRFGQAWKARQSGSAPPPGHEEFHFDFGDVQGGPFGGSGFSSFFEMLFGQAAGGHSGPGGASWASWSNDGRGGWARPGANVESTIRLGLEEAARGGVRELHLSDPAGGAPKRLRVNVPKGVRPGQSIRVQGQGSAGRGSGPAGDLLLRVDVAPHPRFRLEGRDLHLTLEVSPWEAALGGEAAVPTLDGSVRVRIPAGTSSGRKIRIRGRGFPGGRNEPDGDLIAEIRVVVPAALTDRERELYEALRDASSPGHTAERG